MLYKRWWLEAASIISCLFLWSSLTSLLRFFSLASADKTNKADGFPADGFLQPMVFQPIYDEAQPIFLRCQHTIGGRRPKVQL